MLNSTVVTTAMTLIASLGMLSCRQCLPPDEPMFTLGFQDSTGPVLTDTIIYDMFEHRERHHTDSIKGSGIHLPLDISDTISTFVLSGPNQTDTIRLTYHFDAGLLYNSRKCGYALRLNRFAITYTTLDVIFSGRNGSGIRVTSSI